MSKKTLKTILIGSAILFGVGAVLCFIAFAFAGFDKNNLSPEKFEQKSIEISDTFNDINIKFVSENVEVLPSENDKISISYYESQRIKTDINVTNNILNISRVDNRMWFQKWFTFINRKITVILYLPVGEYGNLTLKTVSGEICLAKDVSFDSVSINSTSGDIFISNNNSNDMSLNSVSGDINLVSSTVKNLDTKTVSGEITLENLNSENVNLETVSGDVDINTSKISHNLKAETVSGEIDLNHTTCSNTKLKTVSGNVDGYITGKFKFVVESKHGKIRVPSSNETGDCFNVDTVSGNISIRTY